MLQYYRSAAAQIHYYAFDILALKGKDLTQLPLAERRLSLNKVAPENDHVSLSAISPGSAADMLKFVKTHGLEGVVAKRADSVYQPGKRTGLWRKYRVNLGQEFVIGGYTPGTHGIDALIIGFYRGKDLIYAARVRAGFVPVTRRETFAKIKDLKTPTCPFANLPEKTAGRWGQGLTAAKMKDCVWLCPEAVARIDFLEWTGADHLRHTNLLLSAMTKIQPRSLRRPDNQLRSIRLPHGTSECRTQFHPGRRFPQLVHTLMLSHGPGCCFQYYLSYFFRAICRSVRIQLRLARPELLGSPTAFHVHSLRLTPIRQFSRDFR